jgi:uncharacterized RDD family membrane protein YckC
MVYAGFWLRFLAMLIDGFINLAIAWAICFAASLDAATLDQPMDAFALLTTDFAEVVMVTLYFVYYVGFEGSPLQATPGKLALGLTVVDRSGRGIGFLRALGRNLGKAPSSIILYVGFLMAAFTERKQTLHDMMAGCVVIRR